MMQFHLIQMQSFIPEKDNIKKIGIKSKAKAATANA